jgi:hypothetical protein
LIIFIELFDVLKNKNIRHLTILSTVTQNIDDKIYDKIINYTQESKFLKILKIKAHNDKNDKHEQIKKILN